MDLDRQAARRVGTTLAGSSHGGAASGPTPRPPGGGPWRLERLIGTGGTGAVYEASGEGGRRAAIKVLHAELAQDPEITARFEREARAATRFEHPGKVEVRGAGVAEDGAPFLVMELCDGEPLSALARRPGGVPPGELLRLADELLDVLAAAHAQGIIHRDVKPDNLFVLRDGRLKVLDFGIARVREGAVPKPLTQAGAALGTAPYMPPEQIRGEEIDARADLFAVGATMFRLIAGRRVHEAEGETQILLRMANEPAPPLASAAPEAQPDLCLVVDRALMFDREQRYPDARTMQADVRELREGLPPTYATAHAGDAPDGARALSGPTTVVLPPSVGGAASRPLITGNEPTAAMPAVPDPISITRAPVGSRLPAVLGPATAGEAAAPSERTLRPGALADVVKEAAHEPAPSSAATASAPVPTPEPSTQPMTTVPFSEGAPPDASRPGFTPGSERTLRSQGVVAPVKPAGYTVTPAVPMAKVAGAVRGPPTQPAGAAPLAPGESVPVVAPSLRAPKARELSILPLVIVGVVFGALGISLTLWIMLKDHPDETTAAASASSEPASEPTTDTGSRWPLHTRPGPTTHATSKPHPRPPHATPTRP